MHKNKWDWLEKRIYDCGLTKSSFSKLIDWPITRVSEMTNGFLVNDGKYRNFPQDKVRIAAKILDIPFENLYEYNIGNTDTISFEKLQHSATDKIDIELLIGIFDTVDRTLTRLKRRDVTAAARLRLAIEFYHAGYGRDGATNDEEIQRGLKLVNSI